MPALRVWALAAACVACKTNVTPAQCESLVDRFAELMVKEEMPDASPATVEAEKAREKVEAAKEDVFRNCATEVRPASYDCAMKAETTDALVHCLE